MGSPASRGSGRAAALGSAALVLASLLCCVLFLEVALRVSPGLLGTRTANQLFSVYSKGPGGIYFREPRTDMLFMHPRFETRAWFNGYAWRHATDERGFRNPPGRPVDGVLLLGDSLVYGHGVEEVDGIAAQLESRHGRRVYNLARQGDALHEHYVLLRMHLETFHPEAVVLFVFHNDFDDLIARRGIPLLESAPELSRDDYSSIRDDVAGHPSNPHSWARRLRHGSLTYRLFLTLRSRLQRETGSSPEPGSQAANPLDRPLLDPDTRAVLAQYYERLLGDLAVRCADLGARLIVVYLDAYPTEAPGTLQAKQYARALLADAAKQGGFALFDTGDRLRCDACALPGDGHLTAEGHRRLAEFVDGLLPPDAARRENADAPRAQSSKTGRRFSRKAAMPSCASGCWEALAITSVAYS